MSMWLFCGTHIFRPSQFHRWNFTRNVRIVGIRLIVFFAVAIFVSSNYPFCSFGAGVCITDSLNWRKDKINGVQSYVVLSQSKLRNKIEIDETQEISNFIHGFVLGCNLYVCFVTFLSFFSVGLAWHRYSSQPFIRPSNIINAMVFPLACTIFGGTKKKKQKNERARLQTNARQPKPRSCSGKTSAHVKRIRIELIALILLDADFRFNVTCWSHNRSANVAFAFNRIRKLALIGLTQFFFLFYCCALLRAQGCVALSDDDEHMLFIIGIKFPLITFAAPSFRDSWLFAPHRVLFVCQRMKRVSILFSPFPYWFIAFFDTIVRFILFVRVLDISTISFFHCNLPVFIPWMTSSTVAHLAYPNLKSFLHRVCLAAVLSSIFNLNFCISRRFRVQLKQ